MAAKSSIAGLITGIAGGFISSLYVIYEALLRPNFDVLFVSLTTVNNFIILIILTSSFGVFGFGIGYLLEKKIAIKS